MSRVSDIIQKKENLPHFKFPKMSSPFFILLKTNGKTYVSRMMKDAEINAGMKKL